MPAINYVKFQRGLISAFNAQKERGLLDSNTLYFIYESTSATSGQLYLGDKLISSVGSGTSVTKLSDLKDVLIDATASAGSILTLNSEGKWVTTSIQDIADLVASQSSLGFQVDTNVFELVPVNGSDSLKQLNLNGFGTADSGALAMKGTDGKLIWDTSLKTQVSNLEQAMSQINKNIADQIANANHLTYKKVNTISEAVEENVIYLVPKVGSTDSYDEYMFVNGQLERLGDWGVDLSGYATISQLQAVDNKFADYLPKTDFQTTVGDLTKLTNYTTGNTLVDEINLINERLIWQEIASI